MYSRYIYVKTDVYMLLNIYKTVFCKIIELMQKRMS